MTDRTEHALRERTTRSGIWLTSGAGQVELTIFDGPAEQTRVLFCDEARALAEDILRRVDSMTKPRAYGDAT